MRSDGLDLAEGGTVLTAVKDAAAPPCGGLRPSLTAAPRGAPYFSGRDGETPLRRTEKHAHPFAELDARKPQVTIRLTPTGLIQVQSVFCSPARPRLSAFLARSAHRAAKQKTLCIMLGAGLCGVGVAPNGNVPTYQRHTCGHGSLVLGINLASRLGLLLKPGRAVMQKRDPNSKSRRPRMNAGAAAPFVEKFANHLVGLGHTRLTDPPPPPPPRSAASAPARPPEPASPARRPTRSRRRR